MITDQMVTIHLDVPHFKAAMMASLRNSHAEIEGEVQRQIEQVVAEFDYAAVVRDVAEKELRRQVQRAVEYALASVEVSSVINDLVARQIEGVVLGLGAPSQKEERKASDT